MRDGRLAIWGQREAAAFAFAAVAAVKKREGILRQEMPISVIPSCFRLPPSRIPLAPLYPRQPLSPALSSGRQLCTSSGPTSQVSGPLRDCQLPIVLRASPAFLSLMKGNA